MVSHDRVQAAAKGKHEAFLQLLLQYQPDLAKRVTVAKPREMAELLFTHGMDRNRPNWVRRAPLHHLASDGDVESAALFIDHGADINARGAAELICGVARGRCAQQAS